MSRYTEPDKNAFIIVINYKGHVASHELNIPDGVSIDDYLKKKKIHGCVEEIWEPGTWVYDPETLSPTREWDLV